MKKVNEESMRYRIPGTANRFWQVHARFILLCLLAAVMAITVALSYFTIKKVQLLSAKPLFLFFCPVDDPDAAKSALKHYDFTLDVYLVRYSEEFLREGYEETSSGNRYDFTPLGEEVEREHTDAWERSSTALVYIDYKGDASVVSYNDLAEASVVEEAGTMTLRQIETAIDRAMNDAF